MRIRENLGTFSAGISKTTPLPVIPPQIGKVFGVVLNENTPSKEAFEKVGGYAGLGAIFYMDYNRIFEIDQSLTHKYKINMISSTELNFVWVSNL